MGGIFHSSAELFNLISSYLRPARSWRYEEGKRDLRLDLLRGFAVIAMVADHIGGERSWLYAITGGDAALVDALGGAGLGQANILLTASVFGFTPDVGTLLADNEIFNSDFAVSLSGTLVPLTAAPFVPEPSTALLLGGGLIALIGVSRRARR